MTVERDDELRVVIKEVNMDITQYTDLNGAAARTGMATHIIWSNAKYGNLPFSMLGSRRVYRVSDLDEFAAKHRAGAFPVGKHKGKKNA